MMRAGPDNGVPWPRVPYLFRFPLQSVRWHHYKPDREDPRSLLQTTALLLRALPEPVSRMLRRWSFQFLELSCLIPLRCVDLFIERGIRLMSMHPARVLCQNWYFGFFFWGLIIRKNL